MTTDLHAALRAAVADEPFDTSDVRDLLDVGARRARRRTAVRIGSCALAVALVAVVTAVVVGSDGPRRDTSPAHVVRLDVSRAEHQDLDVLDSVRTTWREPMNDLDHDRFLGLTTDGLALRSRSTRDGNFVELGLANPGTGSTAWLPPPPAVADTAVELTGDRLVLAARAGAYRLTLLVFDRSSATWETSELRLPRGIEVHMMPRLDIGSDGRLYVGSNFEDESGPWHWWSYDVRAGGPGRAEPDLDGTATAWEDGVQARASGEGRVVVSTTGSERLVADQRPAGCELPTEPGLGDLPPTVALAGADPVVTYWCGNDSRPLTAVYRAGGRESVEVSGVSLLAADGRHVLLAGGRFVAGLYLLDLDELTITRVGRGLHDEEFALAGDLVLLNRPGPDDAEDVYDVLWEVARLPGSSG